MLARLVDDRYVCTVPAIGWTSRRAEVIMCDTTVFKPEDAPRAVDRSDRSRGAPGGRPHCQQRRWRRRSRHPHDARVGAGAAGARDHWRGRTRSALDRFRHAPRDRRLARSDPTRTPASTRCALRVRGRVGQCNHRRSALLDSRPCGGKSSVSSRRPSSKPGGTAGLFTRVDRPRASAVRLARPNPRTRRRPSDSILVSIARRRLPGGDAGRRGALVPGGGGSRPAARGRGGRLLDN